MAKEEEEEVKPSSSDAIIASLINEVRKTNEVIFPDLLKYQKETLISYNKMNSYKGSI